jgi:hypothetical protein
MAGRQCYHCKEWIEEGQEHDCWTTTEAALTQDLSEDLRDAWERVRETAVSFGDQRIYASHKSIMFARQSCYFFVRPKRNFLELCVFMGREVKAPQVRRVDRASKSKVVHTIRIMHRDEVEAPVTDWLREAYAFSAVTPAKTARKSDRAPRPNIKPKTKTKTRPKAARSSLRENDDQQGLRRSSNRIANAIPFCNARIPARPRVAHLLQNRSFVHFRLQCRIDFCDNPTFIA